MHIIDQKLQLLLVAGFIAALGVRGEAQNVKRERKIIRVENDKGVSPEFVRIESQDGTKGELSFFRPKRVAAEVVAVVGEKMEKRTWLGVHIGRVSDVMAAQLGLDPHTGLVVEHVVEESPAAKAGIQKFDILTHLNDQLLVNPEQLQVLVAAAEAGTPVPLTLIRQGRKRTVDANLEIREMPAVQATNARRIIRSMTRSGQPGQESEINEWVQEGDKTAEALDELIWKGKVRDDVGALHSRVIKLGNAVTVLKDDTGTIHLRSQEGKRHLRYEDKEGKILFEGPVDDENKKKIPAEVLLRLETLELPEDLGDQRLRKIFNAKEVDAVEDDIDIEILPSKGSAGRSL